MSADDGLAKMVAKVMLQVEDEHPEVRRAMMRRWARKYPEDFKAALYDLSKSSSPSSEAEA